MIHYLKNKKWIKRECHGCKSYNPECERGTCNLNPYGWKDVEKKRKKMIHRKMKKAEKPDIFYQNQSVLVSIRKRIS